MKKQNLFVANWKMSMPFNDAVAFVAANYTKLVTLAQTTQQSIVICPSFEAIYPLQQLLKATPINVGAQNCSAHLTGAFTGQVCIQSLKEVGCTHCIIGHSESRIHEKDTSIDIAKKASDLIDFGITPIVCIGEEEKIYKEQKTLDLLMQQITPVLKQLNSTTINPNHITPYFAYEPIWAIGTDNLAPLEHIEFVSTWLHKQITQLCSHIPWKFLYGGSITSQHIQQLKKLPLVDGFLIGKASLDFQEFEKIVRLGVVD